LKEETTDLVSRNKTEIIRMDFCFNINEGVRKNTYILKYWEVKVRRGRRLRRETREVKKMLLIEQLSKCY